MYSFKKHELLSGFVLCVALALVGSKFVYLLHIGVLVPSSGQCKISVRREFFFGGGEYEVP